MFRLIISILFVSLVFSACSYKRMFNYTELKSSNDNHLNINKMIPNEEYYLTYKTSINTIKKNKLSIDVFCEKSDEFGASDLFNSVAFFKYGINDKNYLEPFFVYKCKDKSSGSLPLNMLSYQQYLIITKGSDLSFNIQYSNDESKDKTNLVSSVIDEGLKYMPQASVVAGIAEFTLSSSFVNELTKLKTYSEKKDNTNVVDINSIKRLHIDIEAIVEDNDGKNIHKGIVYSYSFLPIVKMTKTGLDSLSNGYPDFSIFKNPLTSINNIGLETNDIIKINEFRNYSNLRIFSNEINSLKATLLMSKKYTNVDIGLILYLAYTKSDFYKKSFDNNLTMNELIRNKQKLLDFLDSNENILNDYLLVFTNTKLPYQTEYNKLNTYVEDYSFTMQDEKIAFEKHSDRISFLLSYFKSSELKKSNFSRNNNHEMIKTFNAFKKDIHGCYLYIQNRYSNTSFQDLLVPNLRKRYSYIMFQRNKEIKKNRLIMFRGKFTEKTEFNNSEYHFIDFYIDDNFINRYENLKNFISIVKTIPDNTSECKKSIQNEFPLIWNDI